MPVFLFWGGGQFINGFGGLLKDKQGNVAETPLQARRIWQEHFASILGGHKETFDKMAKDSMEEDERHWQERQVLSLKHVIWKGEVAALCRAAKPHKVTGVDTIPAEVFRKLPGESAEILFPFAFQSHAMPGRTSVVQGLPGC